ncbi:MAG TPA: hypothetical protein PK166_00170 [Candidatus Hydrogenedentes bacterium]|nr:hypothetical protein [Candidatus Hydrogenedentota bacterium]
MRTAILCNARVVPVLGLIALLGMAAAGAASAQENRPPVTIPTVANDTEARLVTVEQGDIKLIERVLCVFEGSLSHIPIEDMNTIVLYGRPSVVKSAEELIRQLDRPVHGESAANIVFTVDILTNVKELGAALTENAAAAAEQVRKDFPAGELFLMDRILMRTRDGSSVQGNGFIPLGGAQPSTYQFQVERATIETAPEKQVVRADEMTIGAELFMPEPEGDAAQAVPAPPVRPRPGGQNRYNVGLRAGILVLQPGQPFVASKQNLTPGEALYFVVTARIEE